MVKHSKIIALAAVALLVAVLAVALIITVPRYIPSTDTTNDQTSLTPDQQQRVDDRLNRCFDTGDC